MKYFTTAILTLAFTCAAQAADLKIGVVDMNKVFTDYTKTKEAQVALQENLAKAKEELNERFAKLKKLNDEVEKAAKEAQDPILSEQLRGQKRAEVQAKAQEFKSLERDIGEFRQRRDGQLQQEGMQQRKGLYEEILKVVNEKAKTDGYDLVFDKSGLGALGLPFLIHAKEGVTQDFTAEVIVELNKNASTSVGTAAAAAPAGEPASAPPAAPGKKKK